jgi:hypothetical protein
VFDLPPLPKSFFTGDSFVLSGCCGSTFYSINQHRENNAAYNNDDRDEAVALRLATSLLPSLA